jgi:hypothetical protein
MRRQTANHHHKIGHNENDGDELFFGNTHSLIMRVGHVDGYQKEDNGDCLENIGHVIRRFDLFGIQIRIGLLVGQIIRDFLFLAIVQINVYQVIEFVIQFIDVLVIVFIAVVADLDNPVGHEIPDDSHQDNPRKQNESYVKIDAGNVDKYQGDTNQRREDRAEPGTQSINQIPRYAADTFQIVADFDINDIVFVFLESIDDDFVSNQLRVFGQEDFFDFRFREIAGQNDHPQNHNDPENRRKILARIRRYFGIIPRC